MHFQRAEDELLVLLACPTVEPEQQHAITALEHAQVDWVYLLKQAYAQDVLLTVYANLRAYCPSCLNYPEVQPYKQICANVSFHNLMLTAELVNAVKLLRANDIPSIPLKGPVLAQLVYGDVQRRMFSDLDILVPEDQFEQAKQVLLEHGYELSQKQLSRIQDKSGRKPHEYILVKNQQIYIELHWVLEPLWYATHQATADFWDSAKPTPCFGTTMIMPQSEEMLLYLCRHGSRHLWNRLKWLCDIRQYLYVNPTLDWDIVLQRAENSQSKRLLLVALYLSQQLFGMALPPLVAQAIAQDSGVEPIGSQIIALIFSDTTSTPQSERFTDKVLMRLQLRDGRFTRLRFTYELIKQRLKPNANDREIIDLPSYLSIFYYVIRYVRLLRTYGATTLRRQHAHEQEESQDAAVLELSRIEDDERSIES